MERIQNLILTLFTMVLALVPGTRSIDSLQLSNSEAASTLRPVAAGYPIILTSSANVVEYGGYATLTAQTNGMTQCMISGGIYGGGQNVFIPLWSGWTGALVSDTSFSLLCTDSVDVRYEIPIVVTVRRASPPTLTIAPSITPTNIPVLPTATPIPSPTVVSLPISSPTPTITLALPTPTLPAQATPTSVVVPNPTSSPVPPSPIASPVLARTPTPTPTPTKVPSLTQTPPTPSPTKSPTHTPTQTSTPSPTKTPTRVPTPIYPTITPVKGPPSGSASSLITSTHRYQSGFMFGGWGPHLGHLMRAADKSLWFVDDTGNDVQKVPALQYFHKEQGKWVLIGSNTTYGRVQQNFGSVLKYDVIYSYGVDVENHKIEECYFVIATRFGACNLLPFALDANANYVGAALTPSGYTMVWWTNVYEGAGSFEYIYNFGGGWNGPVKSFIGAYSDVSYINIDFQNDNSFVMLAQGVTGTAPSWNYNALIASGTLGKPIAHWSPIESVSSTDKVISTNDVWIDASGGAHLLTRTKNGGLQYGYKSSSSAQVTGAWVISNAYRGRFAEDGNGTLSVIYSQQAASGKPVIERADYAKSLIAGPLAKDKATKTTHLLPDGFGAVYALYPESRVYQLNPISDFVFAVTGSTEQGKVYAIQK